MQETIQGTFHFHSTYSHDGRSTLSEIASALRTAGMAFCVLTDHFDPCDGAGIDPRHELAEAHAAFVLLELGRDVPNQQAHYKERHPEHQTLQRRAHAKPPE